MSSSQSDDPINFYFLASWLNSHSKTPLVPEVSRVIIGRAYYAAFLTARDQANQKGTGARIHNEVITHYRAKDSYISNKLSDLKRMEKTLKSMASQCSRGDMPECPIIETLFKV